MPIEQESSEILFTRSPLLQTLHNFPGIEATQTTPHWLYELGDNLKRFDTTISREVGNNWVQQTFYPVYIAVNSLHPIFGEKVGEISAPLHLALFGSGYEIGNEESTLLASIDLFKVFVRTEVVNKQLGLYMENMSAMLDGHDVPYVNRSIFALMRAGSSFSEKRLAVFEDYLGK